MRYRQSEDIRRSGLKKPILSTDADIAPASALASTDADIAPPPALASTDADIAPPPASEISEVKIPISVRRREITSTYTAEAQDLLTLQDLARTCNVALPLLQQENPSIDPDELLKDGQEVTIPSISPNALRTALTNYRDAFRTVPANAQQQTFGAYIKHLRLIVSAVQGNEITQEQLAKKLGYSGSTLANIEAGRKPLPSDRKQHLAWIKVYVELGAINTIGTANRWLYLSTLRNLDLNEQEEIFGQRVQSSKTNDSINRHPLVTITLKKEEWFSTDEERDQYLKDFEAALAQRGIVATVKFALPGSVKVFVDIPPDQMPKLLELLASDPEMREKYPVEGIILSQVNFSNKDFSESNFVGGNFSDAVLQGVQLRGSNLSNTLFIGADLRRADLTNAKLDYADLSFADLRGTNLNGVDLQTVTLDYVLSDESTQWVKPDHATPQEFHHTRSNDNDKPIPPTLDSQSPIPSGSEAPITSKPRIPQFLRWFKWILIGLPLFVFLIYTDPLGLTLGTLLGPIGVWCNVRIARFVATPPLKYTLIVLTFIATLFVYILLYGILD